MKRSRGVDFAVLCLGLVPTLSACAIRDFAGDAGVGGAYTAGDLDAGAGGLRPFGQLDAGAGGTLSLLPLDAGAGGTLSLLPLDAGAGGTRTSQTTGGSTANPTTLPTWATADGCVTGNDNSPLVGTWEGYIQGTPIGDEASSIRLSIVGANSQGLCGTVTFGTHTAPVTLPPATDATADYPPGSVPAADCNRGASKPTAQILGLPYTIQNGRLDGLRTTFIISYNEIYRTWCPLQTSYPNNLITGYNCLPNTGARVDSGKCYSGMNGSGWQEVSCTQMCLCTGTANVCACGPQGCAANPDTSEALFDLLFNGSQAMGTFGSSNVVFNRVAACLASGRTCGSNADCCSAVCAASNDGGLACQ